MAPEGDDQGVDYICINKGNFEMFLRELLLVKSYRVEVYTKSGPSSEWVAEFKGSPGNLIQFENLLFNNEMVVGSSIIAVNMKQNGQRKVSLCQHSFFPIILITCADFIFPYFISNEYSPLELHVSNKMSKHFRSLNSMIMIFGLN